MNQTILWGPLLGFLVSVISLPVGASIIEFFNLPKWMSLVSSIVVFIVVWSLVELIEWLLRREGKS